MRIRDAGVEVVAYLAPPSSARLTERVGTSKTSAAREHRVDARDELRDVGVAQAGGAGDPLERGQLARVDAVAHLGDEDGDGETELREAEALQASADLVAAPFDPLALR